MEFDFIFVVLVYKNTSDLKDFLENFQIKRSKIVVVNSFFDADTDIVFHKLADKYEADFLSVPNKGYSFGNNIGCEYALKNYSFKYLVISNADILIKDLDISNLDPIAINAPFITTIKNKQQNPYMPCYIPKLDVIKCFACLNNLKFLFYSICAINRIIREIWLRVQKDHFDIKKIYAAHGSFVIIPSMVLKQLFPLFNNKMFLFLEEEHLARKARLMDVNIVFNPYVKILHKEDGSVSLIGGKILNIAKQSYKEYYKYWCKK